MKLPFYKKIIVKIFITISVILSLSFFTSYIITTTYTNNIINKNISKEFTNALNIAENFIKVIGQTSQIWAKHTILNNDLTNKIITKDLSNLSNILKIEKNIISADSIILLNKKGQIISQVGSNYQVTDYLSYQDIVKQTFLLKAPITKILRERESLIVYSSYPIIDKATILGMVLIGYFINDTFLENIKTNDNIKLAFVGNSAIMSSTKWGEETTLDILPVDYIAYQTLLKNQNHFKRINHKNNEYIVSARKLKNIDSSISASILIGHTTKYIDKIKDELFYQILILFSSVFLITLIILLYLSKRILSSIDILTNSTLQIISGNFKNRINLSTNDEFQILAMNFNTMIDSIELKNKQLELYTQNLEEEVKKQTKELIKKEHIILQQSKMASMGEMLENIAHQWRQPLSVISSASTGILMQREFGLSTNEKENEALTTINNSAQFLSQTISDFKDFFNTNKNKESFNIKDIYLKTLGIIKSKFEKDDIEIIEKLDSIDMVGLKGELTQVFINILNNARDILITKSDQKLFIFVDIYKDKNNVIVEIKDNAGGIAPDILNKVFEPYFTTKHKAQGTGIGLYICQNIIVKNMNGELSVENEKYRYEGINYTGANFKIIIPQDNIGN